MLNEGDEPVPGYRLEGFLGRGQFGEVWRASSPGGAAVALKFLDLRERQGVKELRAVQQIKTIRHPHLASVIALWLLNSAGDVLGDNLLSVAADNRPRRDEEVQRDTQLPTETATLSAEQIPRRLVVATLLCDKNLCDRLKECQQQGLDGIPPDELLSTMAESAKGIDFLNAPQHRLEDDRVSIQHCDIKPANIMLTGDSVMIGDFGLARFFSDSWATLTGTEMAGSPAYMAPECINQRPSPNTDQYSLAITYFELRTGRLPFASASVVDVLDAHRNGTLDLSALESSERTVISKATAVDPKARFGSCQDMVRALAAAFADDESASTPHTERSRHGQRLVGVLVLTVAITGAVIGSRFLKTPNPPTNSAPLAARGISRESLALAQNHAREAFQIAARAEDDLAQWDTAVTRYQQALRIDRGTYAVVPPLEAVVNQPEQDRFTMRCLATSHGRDWLVTRLHGNQIVLWQLGHSPFTHGVIHEHQNASQSSGDICNVTARGQYVVSADLDERICITKLDNAGSVVTTVRPTKLRGWALSISFDQRWLVAGNLDGHLHRWDLSWQDPQSEPVLLGQHADQVHEVVVTPDNHWAISASTDGHTSRWNLQQPDPTSQDAQLTSRRTDSSALAVSGDGQFVAFGKAANQQGEYPIALVRLTNGPSPAPKSGHLDAVSCLAFGPPSSLENDSDRASLLASGSSDGSVHVWDLAQPDSRALNGQHTGEVRSIVFGPVAGWIASGSDDGTVRLWHYSDPASRPLVLDGASGRIAQVAITPRWLVAGCHNGALLTWDLRRCLVVKLACDALQIPVAQPAAK